MRTIKFRAWDGVVNQMFPVGILGFCKGGISVSDGYVRDAIGYPLMQYTGLLDSQNKEIYEGDFLAVDWTDQRYPPHITGPVEWDDDNACWNLGEGGSPKQDAKSHMEIIGNIYENPELLN